VEKGIFTKEEFGERMRTKVGLWIDHRRALIVAVMDKGAL
jgi:hypothetical protein